MSVGGEFTKPQGGYAGNHPEVVVLDAYSQNGERLKDAIELATAGPTAATMAELYDAIKEAKSFIKLLHTANFYGASGNEMLVSQAIATYLENIKLAFLWIKRLYPDADPADTIMPDQLQDETEPPSLEIMVNQDPVTLEDEERESETINRLAKLMVERDLYESGRISSQMRSIGVDAYDKLREGLDVYSPTKDFLKKEARKKKLKTVARKFGLFVVAIS